MGKILENFSKELVRRKGVLTPAHLVAHSYEEVIEAARELGKPVVLKGLVPVGKRGKAGAVLFADTPEEAGRLAKKLFGKRISHFPIEKILVEEKLPIKQEWYVSITIDKNRKLPVILASLQGGIDIEEIVEDYPNQLITCCTDPFVGLPAYKAKEIWSDLGLHGSVLNAAASALVNLYQTFVDYDAYLLEVNPLVLTTDGKVMAAATVLSVDDAALFRQPELESVVEVGAERAWRPLTELEKKMVEVNESDPYRGTARYTEMDEGNIGFMCGGGGGSLLCFDALVSLGGKPANYTEFGGNPPEEKVYGLAKGILSKPGVKGLFVAQNITNNTQIDVVARGIVRAMKELRIDPKSFPIVVRQAGVNDQEGKRIFVESGVTYYGDDITILTAAEKMIEKMRHLV